MQPRTWAAAAALLFALALTGCGLGAPAASTAPRPAAKSDSVTAVGYAMAVAATPSGTVGIHVNLLVTGATPAAAWTALKAAVRGTEQALRAAGVAPTAIGVAGVPSVSAQVGTDANEASQTVVATLATMPLALGVASRLPTTTLAGYDGSFVSETAVPTLSAAAQTAADRKALAMAQGRAASLALAQGRVLGSLLSSRADVLASEPCGPVSGCPATSGDLAPSAGPGQLVVTVTATYATLP